MALLKTIEWDKEVVDYWQLTSVATATSVPCPGDIVMLQCQTQPCRYRMDGTAPTTAVGTLLPVGHTHILQVGPTTARNFQIIETAVSAKVDIHVFKYKA